MLNRYNYPSSSYEPALFYNRKVAPALLLGCARFFVRGLKRSIQVRVCSACCGAHSGRAPTRGEWQIVAEIEERIVECEDGSFKIENGSLIFTEEGWVTAFSMEPLRGESAL